MSLAALYVILIALGVGLAGQIAYLFIVDHEVVRNSKTRTKEIQAQIKELRKQVQANQIKADDPKFKELQTEMLKESGKMMKQTTKPTFVTLVPFLIVFFIMSAYFSYVPIGIGTAIPLVLSGQVNGSITSASNCLKINDSYNVTIISKKLPETFPSVLNSTACTVFLYQNKTLYNTSITGLIGSEGQKTYSLGSLNMQFSPNPLILATLPFSIPLIGNQLNWFWVYLIISFITSMSINRVFMRLKWIA